uniref:Uncharacterized protein n=1 Tax=Lepeophtheirus salmonis TaxID=72036 RepID=A0A0K2TPA3_LEPSM
MDDLTNVDSCVQLIVYAQYMHIESIKEEFLLGTSLEATTKAKYIFNVIFTFFDEFDLKWENGIDHCTNGTLALLGSRSGF